MKDRTDVLRCRIEYCRRRLSEGVEAGLAQHYLGQIAVDRMELEQIEQDTERRE